MCIYYYIFHACQYNFIHLLHIAESPVTVYGYLVTASLNEAIKDSGYAGESNVDIHRQGYIINGGCLPVMLGVYICLSGNV